MQGRASDGGGGGRPAGVAPAPSRASAARTRSSFETLHHQAFVSAIRGAPGGVGREIAGLVSPRGACADHKHPPERSHNAETYGRLASARAGARYHHHGRRSGPHGCTNTAALLGGRLATHANNLSRERAPGVLRVVAAVEASSNNETDVVDNKSTVHTTAGVRSLAQNLRPAAPARPPACPPLARPACRGGNQTFTGSYR